MVGEVSRAGHDFCGGSYSSRASPTGGQFPPVRVWNTRQFPPVRVWTTNSIVILEGGRGTFSWKNFGQDCANSLSENIGDMCDIVTVFEDQDQIRTDGGDIISLDRSYRRAGFARPSRIQYIPNIIPIPSAGPLPLNWMRPTAEPVPHATACSKISLQKLRLPVQKMTATETINPHPTIISTSRRVSFICDHR